MVLERRTYPLLAVVLTACLVCLSLWRMTSECPGAAYCEAEPPATAYHLVRPSDPPSDPHDLQLSPGDDTALVDLRDFSFLMNDPVCNSTSPPLYVVVVHTAPGHEFNRRAIRSTWGQRARVVFLVGETNSSDTQGALERENAEHRDLVQGSFLDSYRNLTYKHVMGLKWATYHCPGAKYVLKTDDDVFVNTPRLEEFLAPLGARRLVLCDVFYSAIVKRSYRSKWRVSHREYMDRWYPDYCSGWAVLYSQDAVLRLYREAQRSEFFWIDDVHITGTLLNRINYTRTATGNLSVQEVRAKEMLARGQLDDFLFSLVPPSYFYELWDLVSAVTPPTPLRTQGR